MKKKKQQSKALQQAILKIFANDVTLVLGYKALLRKIGKNKYTKDDIVAATNALWERGRLNKNEGNKFCFNTNVKRREAPKKRDRSGDKTATGVVDMTAKGSAYIISEETPRDVFIPAQRLHRAFDGDTVQFRYFRKRNSKKLEGTVVTIVKRKQTEFVGIIKISKRFAFLIPTKKLPVDLFIPLKHTAGAKDGDKVMVKMMDWKKNAKSPTAHVVQVLGKPGENEVEMLSILVDQGFPLGFSPATDAVADKLPIEISEAEIAKRRDMRAVPTFTIDPTDAKDFDDALSVQALDNGNWEIGIHIADVSHYVDKDTIMDKEAAHRSTSVYLVDRVLSMFPENLSNRVCSLRPREDKLCFSAVFELDSSANLVQEWFGRTVIYSDRRFDYEQAQAILDNGKGDFAQELTLLNDLAKKMRANRMQSGAIAFNSEEVKFKLDEQGKPIEVYLKVMKDSNRLIEDFMLLANKRVARLLNTQEPAIPMVNRVHDLPDMEKLTNFKNIASGFGYQLNLNTPKLIAQSLNALLKQVQGKPEQHLLETLAVRSMAKAAYSTNNKGHYGLGFDNYAHFTSPIRRFPDVMVHRILANYLNKAAKPIYTTEELESNCEHCSMMERKAMVAERESIKYKQVEYLSERLGEVFEGIISGVSTFGFWVELKENKCEGMVRLQSMLDDHYIYDERLFCLVGIHSNKKFQLGQTVKVTIVKTDLLMRTVDLELTA